MKKLSILLATISLTFLQAQNIAFDKLYGNSSPENYYLGHYPVATSDGLQIKWHGGIRLATSGGTALQVLMNSNVGIGTETPEAKLDINFGGEPKTIKFIDFPNNLNSMNSALRFSWYNDNSDIGIIRGGSTNILGLGFRFNGDEKMRLTSSGSLGIGTDNPTSKLEIADSGGATLSITTNRINGTEVAPLKPTLEFLGYANYKKARIEATEQTYATHGSKLSFFVNDGASENSLKEMLTINQSGNVGIGVVNPQNKLDVNGMVHAKEVKVDLNGWADFVFEKNYNLPTLEEVEKHISDKGHLPNIPSEKEVLENGLSLGENQKLLLQKIEELTLYSIEQNKQLKLQSEQIKELQKQILQKP